MKIYIPFIIVFLLFIGILEVINEYMVHRQPEVKLSQEFILSNNITTVR